MHETKSRYEKQKKKRGNGKKIWTYSEKGVGIWRGGRKCLSEFPNKIRLPDGSLG